MCCLFVQKRRVCFKTSPQVRYYRDTYAEHPEDRKNIEYSVHLDSEEDLVTLSGVYEQLKHLDDTIKLDYARWDHTRDGNEGSRRFHNHGEGPF